MGKVKHGYAIKTQKRERLYGIWVDMKRRCYSPKRKSDYKDYGARGIRVCDEWHDYVQFRAWAMDNGYKDDLSIDRINVNGNYEPGNCKWSTTLEQANNKRSNHILTLNGESHTISQWATILNIPEQRIRQRVGRQNWSVERALTTPVLPNKNQWTAATNGR